MPYLTYEEYTEMGYSTVPQSVFPRYERIARGDVNYYTLDRITPESEITEPIKLAICEIMEVYASDETDKSVLSGVSTGKYSESYATPEIKTDDIRIRDICLKYLPGTLTSWVVD